MNVHELNQKLIATTDYAQLSNLIYSLAALSDAELDQIEFKQISIDNPLGMAMFCVIATEGDNKLGLLGYKIMPSIISLKYKNTGILNSYEKIEYILYDNHIYRNKNTENILKFEYSASPSITIMDSTTTFECKKIDDTIYTYTTIKQNLGGQEYLFTFKHHTYNTKEDIWSQLPLPHIHIKPDDIPALKQMLNEAEIDIAPIGKQWMENWMYAAMTVADPMADSEFEALCLLLNLNYEKELSKFKLLTSMELLKVPDISNYIEQLGKECVITNELPTLA